MKKLVALGVLFGAFSAGATALDGKVMSCVSNSFLGQNTTNYLFLNDGSEQVLVRSSYFGDAVSSYRLSGTSLSVQDPGTDKAIKFDISNPKSITGVSHVCILPGQGGGGSRPVCGDVFESCHL